MEKEENTIFVIQMKMNREAEWGYMVAFKAGLVVKPWNKIKAERQLNMRLVLLASSTIKWSALKNVLIYSVKK